MEKIGKNVNAVKVILDDRIAIGGDQMDGVERVRKGKRKYPFAHRS